jgi:hypothetical protein
MDKIQDMNNFKAKFQKLLSKLQEISYSMYSKKWNIN